MFHAAARAKCHDGCTCSACAASSMRTRTRTDNLDRGVPPAGNQALLRMRQRAAGRSAATAPQIVHDVLRSPGRPLDADTRAFMEPRFGRSFAHVRLHTDARAARSAQAVNALAYTVGRDIVLGAGQEERSTAGRALLAHELAHVVQQREAGDAGSSAMPLRIGAPAAPAERAAEQTSRAALAGGAPATDYSERQPTLHRTVVPGRVECTASTDGAPADPVAQLSTIVDSAEMLARVAAAMLTLTAAEERAGLRNTTGPVSMAWDDRFGPPAPVSGGFMNRLTGAVRPTEGAALAEEMDLMALRYTLIANALGSDSNHYRCISGETTWRGIHAFDCARDAWTFPGIDAYLLCPGSRATDLTSATLLIHETSHIIWERVFHGAPGSGGNFRHAECYASFVGDLFGIPKPLGTTCPVT